ncbi:uncharacterized protein DNG_06859 [Cephalotrichum gorgonifer]|uniref:Uncharacterized protein n=1 Tax=Cephalotrichum gorgonifer TaxID=2041049 RepID=A0AAE8N0F5_9PEZI|nr:uncharacterized protein DNG_06859 [Cephalotrichum gorgonifer]
MAIVTPLLAFVVWVSYALAQPGCQTQSLSNPIHQRYPSYITGTINGTFVLGFIPRDVADSLLPEGYEFLDDEYVGTLMSQVEGYFPVLVSAVYFHDIRADGEYFTNDYGHISFELPFVNAFRDGRTPFRYTYLQMTEIVVDSKPNSVAERYGVPHIIRSVYDPECDAYQWVDTASQNNVPAGSTKLRGIPADQSRRNIEVVSALQVTREARPFTTEELKGIVSQPMFGDNGDGRLCGGRRVFWGEEDTGFEEVVETKGEVTITGEFDGLDVLWGGDAKWDRVYGIRGGGGFVQEDFVDCRILQWVEPEEA